MCVDDLEEDLVLKKLHHDQATEHRGQVVPLDMVVEAASGHESYGRRSCDRGVHLNTVCSEIRCQYFASRVSITAQVMSVE